MLFSITLVLLAVSLCGLRTVADNEYRATGETLVIKNCCDLKQRRLEVGGWLYRVEQMIQKTFKGVNQFMKKDLEALQVNYGIDYSYILSAASLTMEIGNYELTVHSVMVQDHT